MKTFLSEAFTSIALTLALALVVCGAYPLATTLLGQTLFRDKANGSLTVNAKGEIVGSTLLSQNFSDPAWFHPRPSAAGNGYDGLNSGGTNLGPTSQKLALGSHAVDSAGKAVDDPGNFDGIKDLVSQYRQENGLPADAAVPADAVTRSGSGLDPHISLENARIQAARVARARKLPIESVLAVVESATDHRDLGVFGEAGVNVLKANIALQQAKP
jgi:potassium-transporting ATPase KdpC subunit